MENYQWKLRENDCTLLTWKCLRKGQKRFHQKSSVLHRLLTQLLIRLEKNKKRDTQYTSMLLVVILLFNYTVKMWLKTNPKNSTDNIFHKNKYTVKVMKNVVKTSFAKHFSECEYKIYYILTLKVFCFHDLVSNWFCIL